MRYFQRISDSYHSRTSACLLISETIEHIDRRSFDEMLTELRRERNFSVHKVKSLAWVVTARKRRLAASHHIHVGLDQVSAMRMSNEVTSICSGQRCYGSDTA